MNLDVAGLRAQVRDIPDWPRPGVTFRDITPLLAQPGSLGSVVDVLAESFAAAPVDVVFGVEARGFILAAPVAYRLQAGFVPVRKAGRLPAEIEQEEYTLEYGSDLLEVHNDAAWPGARVLIVDDVIATGGTAAATVRLARRLGAEVVGIACLLELTGLGGRSQLDGIEVVSLLSYDEDD